MTYRVASAFLMGVLLCVLPVTAASQALIPPATSAKGMQPFGSFDGGPDAINLGDLNVHWSFPVAHKAGRGINFDYSLSYDSSIWSPSAPLGYGATWVPAAHFGWEGIGPGGSGGFLSYSEISAIGSPSGVCSIGAGTTDYNYVFVDSLGNPHWFGSGAFTQDCGSPNQFGFPATATDGSGITLQCNGCGTGSTMGFAIALPSGQIISVPPVSPTDYGPTVLCPPTTVQSTILDSNGNKLVWNNASIFAGANIGTDDCYLDINAKTGLPTYVDTLGSTVMNTTAEGLYDYWTNNQNLQHLDGTPDGEQDGTGNIQDATVTMTFPGLGYSSTITNSPFEVATSFGCPVIEYDTGPPTVYYGTYYYQNLVTQLQGADGSFYTLSYQPTQPGSSSVTGMLSSVGLPHGGSISYTYGPINCADGSPLSLTRKVDDGNGHISTWTYQRTYLPLTSQWQTIVTDPNQNQTVHLFVTGNTGAIPNETVGVLNISASASGVTNFYEVSKVVYSGLASGGVVLQATNTCYNGNTTGAYVSNCTTPSPVTYPFTSVQTTVKPDGGSLTAATVQLFNGLELPTESDVYDYGSTNGQVGALLSRTTTAYAGIGSILNKPSLVMQYDGSGNELSSTSYTYDEGDVIATSGTPGHQNIIQTGATTWTNITNRGNLTTIKRGGGTNSLTTHYTYYDTGLVATATDSNGATVSYNYSQCGNSFLSGTTQTVQPSGIPLSTSESWNCDGGVPTSTTDVNGNLTAMSYDPIWRPTSSVDPLGNTTTVTYPTLSSNTSTVTKTYTGGLPGSSSLTAYDGLGRAILTQVPEGPGAVMYATTSQLYDSSGHVAYSSIPYSAPSYAASSSAYNTSNPGTKAHYDPLGRPESVSDAGGGTLSYTYRQNDTMITQGPAAGVENVKSRQLQYNAAGQLTSVCEITQGTAANPGGLCFQTYSSSIAGYLTTYKYSGGLLTGVSQNVQAGPSATQTRSMSYDILGRKTAETIPETGTSSFFYDVSQRCGGSSGDLVESIDNAGNVTCMGYDSLHRMTSSQVISGPYASVTPQTTYVYDAATLNGTPMQNALGSLAAVHTSLCPASGCVATDVYQDSYFETGGGIKTGRVVSQMWESTPNSNGYVLTQSISNANGTPASLSASLNGAPVGFPTMSYGLDTWGRPSTAIDNTNGKTLLSGTSYDPLSGAVAGLNYGNSDSYGSGDSDVFGHDPNTGRPTSFTYNIGGTNPFTVSGGLTWNPNGSLQLFTMNDSSDPSKTQNCQYQMDDINRLASVNCAGSWAQSFSYDPFGNINKNAPLNGTSSQSTSTYQPGYNSINNQVMSGTPAAYDPNGNQTLAEFNSLTWNAAAQPVTVNGVTAVYDGLGRVVETDSGNIAAGTDSRSSGSITIAGSEQMIPASLAAGASAVVTITGTEQSMPINLDTTVPDGCVPVVTTTAQYATCYDTGGGYLVILTYDASTGGFLSQSQYSFNYGVGDTAATISDRLAAAINADPAARLVATAVPGAPANQGMINVQLASASSTAVVYNVVAGFGCGDDFNSCSFSIDVPTQLAASQTSCKIPAVYDAGTVSVTVNNGPVASYAWSQSDSPVKIAQSLATAINQVYGSAGLNIVSASAPLGSTVVQLASIGVGPATNYPVATTVSFNSTDFQSSSFTTVAAGMAGGLLSVNGTSAGSTQYVYSPSGAKIAVLQGGQLVKGTVPLPGGGTAVYNASGFGYFRHKDWLGSSRLATNWDHTVYSKEAYAPFGETENNMEQTSSTGQADRSFTGQDQDTTSGIFDYLFRRYDPVAGRWLSPDPSGWGAVSQAYPQSLNRYAYVQNDPMQLTDPDGLDCVYFSTGGGISNISLGECDPTVPGGHYVNGTITTITRNYSAETQGISYDYALEQNGTYTSDWSKGKFDQSINIELGTIEVNDQASSNINCNTKLPNGKTVGDYVRAARTQMNSITGTGSPPLDAYHMLTTFKGLVGGGSAIDFKNTMAGQAPLELLGNAGNFAYYAIGSGYFSAGILDMGAGGYAIKSAFIPSSPVKFSALTMPYGQDTSAKLQEGPGLAAQGCGVKTF